MSNIFFYAMMWKSDSGIFPNQTADSLAKKQATPGPPLEGLFSTGTWGTYLFCTSYSKFKTTAFRTQITMNWWEDTHLHCQSSQAHFKEVDKRNSKGNQGSRLFSYFHTWKMRSTQQFAVPCDWHTSVKP